MQTHAMVIVRGEFEAIAWTEDARSHVVQSSTNAEQNENPRTIFDYGNNTVQ